MWGEILNIKQNSTSKPVGFVFYLKSYKQEKQRLNLCLISALFVMF